MTETFDAAVFGENILDTLIHAWNHLLMTTLSTSECKSAQVIPSCATLWACLIECRKIREYSRLEITFNVEIVI